MNNLDNGKINFNLLNRFPGAKRVGNGIYRVNTCPICGGHDHFTLYEPHSTKNKNPWWTYSSFSGCCNGGSPLDYLIEVENMSKEDAYKELGVNIRNSPEEDFKKTNTNVLKEKVSKNYDFTDLANKLHENCTTSLGMEYFLNRGLNKTIFEYKLGYCQGGYNEALKGYKELNICNPNIDMRAYKYFIPLFDNNDKCYYIIARHDNSIKSGQKTMNMKGLGAHIFNERYLQKPTSNIIFVCEGWADALSFEEIGYKAIALNSTQNANRFVELVKKHIDKLKNCTFIIALDNDSAGQKAIEILESNFKALLVNSERFYFEEVYKDINEYLIADMDGFKQNTARFIEKLTEEDFTMGYLSSLLDQIEANKNKELVSSGFTALDKKLGGGLYPGLYCIGAGSSIGKTTFSLQIADNIASSGNDVLFFSLEMSKNEMIAKSLVREMFMADPKADYIPSTRAFLNGNYKLNVLDKAVEHYKKAAKHIAIIEGSFNYTVSDIRARIEKHIVRKGTKPVVFIDYLQVITPTDVRMSDKQAIDNNIVELKRMSREYDIPVILISSINRANYLNPISFESFKESGSIEYTCDVVIGLQLSIIETFVNNSKEYGGDNKLNKRRIAYNEAKSKDPREIDLVLLKNRNGIPTATHKYIYYPKYNLVEEEGEFTPVNDGIIPF